ncbi:hypothetical protein EDD86DRAFT_247211 [Gorgonomyces haynaldii]|nr:hypothetical protein EDD86DRAFT_247211 [Gorgonomyces haynaldii]
MAKVVFAHNEPGHLTALRGDTEPVGDGLYQGFNQTSGKSGLIPRYTVGDTFILHTKSSGCILSLVCGPTLETRLRPRIYWTQTGLSLDPVNSFGCIKDIFQCLYRTPDLILENITFDGRFVCQGKSFTLFDCLVKWFMHCKQQVEAESGRIMKRIILSTHLLNYKQEMLLRHSLNAAGLECVFISQAKCLLMQSRGPTLVVRSGRHYTQVVLGTNDQKIRVLCDVGFAMGGQDLTLLFAKQFSSRLSAQAVFAECELAKIQLSTGSATLNLDSTHSISKEQFMSTNQAHFTQLEYLILSCFDKAQIPLSFVQNVVFEGHFLGDLLQRLFPRCHLQHMSSFNGLQDFGDWMSGITKFTMQDILAFETSVEGLYHRTFTVLPAHQPQTFTKFSVATTNPNQSVLRLMIYQEDDLIGLLDHSITYPVPEGTLFHVELSFTPLLRVKIIPTLQSLYPTETVLDQPELFTGFTQSQFTSCRVVSQLVSNRTTTVLQQKSPTYPNMSALVACFAHYRIVGRSKVSGHVLQIPVQMIATHGVPNLDAGMGGLGKIVCSVDGKHIPVICVEKWFQHGFLHLWLGFPGQHPNAVDLNHGELIIQVYPQDDPSLLLQSLDIQATPLQKKLVSLLSLKMSTSLEERFAQHLDTFHAILKHSQPLLLDPIDIQEQHPSLEQINIIYQKLQDLVSDQSIFQEPIVIVNNQARPQDNKQLYVLEESLTKLLIQLDGIQTFDQPLISKQRKWTIQQVQKYLTKIDTLKHLWMGF